jgi:hypothetical protein
MSILDDSLSSFESSTPQRLHGGKKFPKGKNLIVVAALAVFAVVGVAASVQLAQRSQEIRNQASVPDGQVLITHSISPEAPQPNEPVTITFKVNTQSVNISGIQLTFTISPSAGQSLSGAPTVSLLSSSGMNQIIAPVITPGANGSYELLIAVAPPVPNSFSSTTPVDFASVTFMPSSVGNINVTFSTEDSLAALHDVPTSGDTLMHIAPFQITVAEAPTSTVEPSVTVTSTITSSPTLTPSNTPTSSPTNSPTSTLSPTQSVTLSPTISLTTAPTSSVSVTLPTMGGTCNSIMMNYLSYRA